MMASVSGSDKFQSLLTKLNIDPNLVYSNDMLIEQLLKEIGDVSVRYSALAAKHLKLLNTQTVPTTLSMQLTPESSNLKNALSHVIADNSAELGDLVSRAGNDVASVDILQTFKSLIRAFKTKNLEAGSLGDTIKSLEHKCQNLELLLKQMEAEKIKYSESRVRGEFYSEFEKLLREDLQKTHLLQQRITESLTLMKHSQGNGDTKHIDALYDSLQTELNLQDHLKKMIEKMNSRRLKQDQEIDVLCEKIASMESTSIQHERDKMVLQNQKRLAEAEKQDLVDKVAKMTKQLQDESSKLQRLEVEIEQKKGAYSALNKAYEMNKNTLEQLKRKDSMIKRHVGQQDSEILKVKSKMGEQEKQMKSLKDELQRKSETIITLTSDRDRLAEQVRESNAVIGQYEDGQRRYQLSAKDYEVEVEKLQGLVQSKSKEKEQFVINYSKILKAYEGLKKEASTYRHENDRLKERMDKLKLSAVPSELKADLEKEIEILRAENQRIREAYSSIDIERGKWKEIMDRDGAKILELMAKASQLEADNDELRHSRGFNGVQDQLQLRSEQERNRSLQEQCERMQQQVWELTRELDAFRDGQNQVAELLRNNWSAQSIRVGDRLADQANSSFMSPLNYRPPDSTQRDSKYFAPARQAEATAQHFDDEYSDARMLEDENKRLMEIVAQVKSDLRQAASQSPSSSVYSP